MYFLASNKAQKLRFHTTVATLLLLVSFGVHADYEEGVNAAFKGDFDIAFHEFSVAAEEGLDLAQYNLAILYFTGQGVEKDEDLAFRWTLAAAIQGHTAAQFNLGSLYSEGNGTELDQDKAVEWFGYAAKAGHSASAYILANMYKDGDHVTRDVVQAHAWASMAVSNDYEDATKFRQSLESLMEPDQLRQARRMYARWKIEW